MHFDFISDFDGTINKAVLFLCFDYSIDDNASLSGEDRSRMLQYTKDIMIYIYSILSKDTELNNDEKKIIELYNNFIQHEITTNDNVFLDYNNSHRNKFFLLCGWTSHAITIGYEKNGLIRR
jgi:hypothetical protein